MHPATEQLWQSRETVSAESSRLQAILRESGERLSRSRQHDPRYLETLGEFIEFLADIYEGRRPLHYLQEAMSTSDFPQLMGDVLDRQLLARYREWPSAWGPIAREATVNDFRTVKRIALDGLEGRYQPKDVKPELAEVTEENALTETAYTYAVTVYQKAASLSWEAIVNDDLDALRSIPDRLARGARRTEEYFVTSLYVDSDGPHDALYDASNRVPGNPPLSVQGLQDAMTVLGTMRDADGEPIYVEAVTLVVPPALEITARNILNSTEILVPATGTAAEAQIRTANWMRVRIRNLVVNPYIPVIATTNGNTSWFLFADPATSRPALEVGFLRGMREPGLYQKAPNTQRVGGGLEPLLGDFETGEIRWKGMHVFGGTRIDKRVTVASDGSGS